MAGPLIQPRRLATVPALAFPFRVEAGAPVTSSGVVHIREQIEQVLFTNPTERVFRPEFGGGVTALVFEPNEGVLWQLASNRLQATLADVLRGEVDPNSIEVEVTGAEVTLEITVRYRLTTIGQTLEETFWSGGSLG